MNSDCCNHPKPNAPSASLRERDGFSEPGSRECRGSTQVQCDVWDRKLYLAEVIGVGPQRVGGGWLGFLSSVVFPPPGQHLPGVQQQQAPRSETQVDPLLGTSHRPAPQEVHRQKA